MSIMIMSRLFRMNLGGCNRKLLAVRLADFADDEGRGIYPGVKRLASETELSERTIQRILADFVQEGILVIVKEATGRPGIANAYDFDLAKLFSYKPAQTGDSVSPVETVETGDNPAETGDTDDRDGCHRDTRTIIEPPIEPSSLRAGVRERSEGRQEPEDRKKIEAAFWALVKDWPNFDTADKQGPLKQWFGLTPEERQAAVARFPAWRATFGNRKHITMPSTYMREKLWNNFPDPVPEGDRSLVHNAFSKAWSAMRLAELLNDPVEPRIQPTAFQMAQLRQGGEAAEAIMRERRLRYGWPKVMTMHQRAEMAEGMTVAPWLVKISEAFESVHRDSDKAQRWRDLHARMGWPWMPEKMEWMFFPIGGSPEEAMEEFRNAVARERSDDDAA